MDNLLDPRSWDYTILDDVTNLNIDDQIVDGLWRLNFDVSCSKNGLGTTLVIEGPNSKMHPHTYKL